MMGPQDLSASRSDVWKHSTPSECSDNGEGDSRNKSRRQLRNDSFAQTPTIKQKRSPSLPGSAHDMAEHDAEPMSSPGPSSGTDMSVRKSLRNAE